MDKLPLPPFSDETLFSDDLSLYNYNNVVVVRIRSSCEPGKSTRTHVSHHSDFLSFFSYFDTLEVAAFIFKLHFYPLFFLGVCNVDPARKLREPDGL